MMLRRALTAAPMKLLGPLRKQMKALNASSAEPPDDGTPPNPMFWAEHRSRITLHKPNVNWCWLICHILNALQRGAAEEAELRCFLALATAEQVALDHGSWTLAWETNLIPEPPYQSFERHALDSQKLPHSALLDVRMVEVLHQRLRQVDEMVERRRRLEKAPAKPPLAKERERPKGKPKFPPKPKAAEEQ